MCSLSCRIDSTDSSDYNITYSFIANCQTAVVHKNKTKRRFEIYKSQYILWYNILIVKLQSVIREMRSGSCHLFTDTSEHIRFLLFSFSRNTFLVFGSARQIKLIHVSF